MMSIFRVLKEGSIKEYTMVSIMVLKGYKELIEADRLKKNKS